MNNPFPVGIVDMWTFFPETRFKFEFVKLTVYLDIDCFPFLLKVLFPVFNANMDTVFTCPCAYFHHCSL